MKNLPISITPSLLELEPLTFAESLTRCRPPNFTAEKPPGFCEGCVQYRVFMWFYVSMILFGFTWFYCGFIWFYGAVHAFSAFIWFYGLQTIQHMGISLTKDSGSL